MPVKRLADILRNRNRSRSRSRGDRRSHLRNHDRHLGQNPGRGRSLKGWLTLFLAVVALAAVGQFLGGASVAYAHGGVAPGDNLWLAWNTTNPLPSLALFLAAYLYVNGLGKWDKPSHPINAWQKISFFSGLSVIFLVLQSPIDPLAEHYFFIHQIQHLVIRMLGPLLVLLGAPLTPMLRGLPLWVLQGGVRTLVRNPLARRAYFYLTNPVVAVFLFLGALYFWQLPMLHNLAIRNDYVHEAMHSVMLFSGFLFWWLVIDPKPHRSRLHYGLRVLYLGLIVLPNTLLGAGITFSTGLLYPAYYEVEQPFVLEPLIDQQLGGLFLWVVGDMMSILAAGIVMIMWYRQEQENDRLEAARKNRKERT